MLKQLLRNNANENFFLYILRHFSNATVVEQYIKLYVVTQLKPIRRPAACVIDICILYSSRLAAHLRSIFEKVGSLAPFWAYM